MSILSIYLSFFSTLILLLFGILWLAKLPNNLRLVFWVVVASASADLISLILGQFRYNTWPIANLFLILQFALLFFVLTEQRKAVFLQWLFYLSLAFAFFNFALIQKPTTFNSYTFYVSGILMIMAALNFLYDLMVKMPVEKVQALPLFWLAFGVLIYYGGTLFLFLFNNYLISHLPERHRSIWGLHNLLNITKNVFLFFALWVSYKSKTSQA